MVEGHAPQSDGTPFQGPGEAPAVLPGRRRPVPVVYPGAVSQLPPFRVVLHDDDTNEMRYVVEVLVHIARLDIRRAVQIMMRAHHRGLAQVLITHKERAELYRSQFRQRRLRVSIEPASE